VRQAADFGVGEARLVQRVEAEHAQEAAEPAEMRVGKEARRGARVGGSRGENFDLVALAHDALERRRRAVHHELAHLGVRHAERLDRVLEVRRTRAGIGEAPAAIFRSQEPRQVLREAEARRAQEPGT